MPPKLDVVGANLLFVRWYATVPNTVMAYPNKDSFDKGVWNNIPDNNTIIAPCGMKKEIQQACQELGERQNCGSTDLESVIFSVPYSVLSLAT
eukprot:scaffold2083_cov419-Prasinococcus_capsulatus_cf.AAC.15